VTEDDIGMVASVDQVPPHGVFLDTDRRAGVIVARMRLRPRLPPRQISRAPGLLTGLTGMLGVLALLGCPRDTVTVTPTPTADLQPQPATGTTHRFSDNWGEPGCATRGDRITLRGRIRVEPFHKGTSGVLLDEDGGEAWALSYRARGVLLQLDGAHVEVRGRACDKQGQALSGKHFDLETLVELED
jgi:hypothetical protein